MSDQEKRPTKKLKKSSNRAHSGTTTSFSTHATSISHSISSLLSSTSPSQSKTTLTTLLDLITSNDFLNSIQSDSHKDQLDKNGVQLWNKSIAVRIELQSDKSLGKEEKEEWWKVFAELRLAAFKIIVLASLSPLTPSSRLSLLTLSTKVSLAFLSLPSPRTTHEVLSIGATHVEALLSTSTSTHDKDKEANQASAVMRAVMEHYQLRVDVAIEEKNYQIADWLRGKLKDLVHSGSGLSLLAMENLARFALETGRKLGLSFIPKLSEEGEESEGEKKQHAVAIEWLLFASELAENLKSSGATTVQLAILKSLAQSYLTSPDEALYSKAEATMSAILDIEPSLTLWRRLIKMMIKRNGNDKEIVEAFRKAAMGMKGDYKDAGRLLTEIHRLPPDRHDLKFSIFNTLVGIVSPPSHLPFLSDIVLAATFAASDKDRATLVDFFDQVYKIHPDAQITSDAAFICSTFLWRFGDGKHKSGKYEEASEWYLVATHSIFGALHGTVWSKSFRKAALGYSEVGNYSKAGEIMMRASKVVNSAKNHFVRFYNSALDKDEQNAISALQQMVLSPDFELKMLLWAAKSAHESGLKGLLATVLKILLETCRKTPSKDVDLVVLVRCLIRMILQQIESSSADLVSVIPALLHHFETSVELVATAARLPKPPATLDKSVAWLHKTGFNLCIQYVDKLDPHSLVQLYGVVASLLELDLSLSGSNNTVTQNQYWFCRFSSLSGKMLSMRGETDLNQQLAEYRRTLPELRKLRGDLSQALIEYPAMAQATELEGAALGLEIEALSGLGEWQAVASLLDVSNPISPKVSMKLVKVLTERVVNATHCPPDLFASILRQALDNLYAREDIDTASLAKWLRAIISMLQEERAESLAFDYFANARTFLGARHASYPPEEAHWLIASAWELGLESFAANARDDAKKWCDMAVDLARIGRSPLHSELQSKYSALLDVKEDAHDTGFEK